MSFKICEKSNLKGVIFDWAGTIVDYGSLAPVAVFLEIFKSKEIELTMSEVRQSMGLNKRLHIQAILQIPRISNLWKQRFGQGPEQKDVQQLYELSEPMLIKIVKNYAKPIPGAIDLFKQLRLHDIKIGSSTGYVRSMMNVLVPAAETYGLVCDSVVASDEVAAGRPYPWMCYLNAINLKLFPFAQMVKFGDTIADIEEGKNAGMWTVAFSKSGNEMGLPEGEVNQLATTTLQEKIAAATKKFKAAGAHFVIDGIWDAWPVIEEINKKIANNEKP